MFKYKAKTDLPFGILTSDILNKSEDNSMFLDGRRIPFNFLTDNISEYFDIIGKYPLGTEVKPVKEGVNIFSVKHPDNTRFGRNLNLDETVVVEGYAFENGIECAIIRVKYIIGTVLRFVDCTLIEKI